MNSKVLKSVLLVSLIFNFSIVSAAGYFYFTHGGTGRAEKRQAFYAKKLGLTPEQVEKIKEEDLRFRAAVESARTELMSKRRSLLSVLKEERPDRAAIDTLLSEIVGLQGKIEAQAIEHIINEKSVLDKEQQAGFVDLLEKRLEKSQSHRGKHRTRIFDK